MKPAYLYARVSTQNQVAGKDGLPRQRDACRHFAKANGYTIAREFLEEGVSGTTATEVERPALADLFLRAEEEGVKTVIVERQDRWARSTYAAALLTREAEKRGLTILCASGQDLTAESPDAALVNSIMFSLAAWERNVIVSKMRAARNRRSQEEGRRIEGRKPYGTLEGEPAALARLIQLRRKPKGGSRLSYRAVCERMNSEGWKTRTGAKWHPQTIHGILNREE